MTNYYNEIDPFAAEWLANLMNNGHIDTRSIMEVQGSDLKGFKQCHFFAGIAVWSEALRLAGWPDNVAVWTGSCPCQPFSAAGKGLGEKDERHLWPEFFRLIAECRPPVIFGEQVASAEVVGTKLEAAFVVAVQGGDYARANKLAKRLTKNSRFNYRPRWIDRVQADLATVGYTFRFTLLGAHSVGAPHIRQRLFWVAESDSSRWPSAMWGQGVHARDESKQGCCVVVDGLADRICERRDTRRRDHVEHDGYESDASRCDGGLGDANNGQFPQHQKQSTRKELTPTTRTSWPDFRIVQCRDGKARRVSAQPGDEPLAYGVPRSMGPLVARLEELGVDPSDAKRIIRLASSNRVGRLRGYGNAIVPQVAAEFIRAFMTTKQKES